ncbi:hypothetical protein BDY19DRAFT_517413 [Irpex rosettiformis]|uniref:Uncharacterized protein n=1 Tax=Irpex rosettiformis TaxID=378272 RepID=A0ACB8TRY4_9APHY|nr:hypothetical protein BDY19DRAFT_517413 [Irpex rosettiformis]
MYAVGEGEPALLSQCHVSNSQKKFMISCKQDIRVNCHRRNERLVVPCSTRFDLAEGGGPNRRDEENSGIKKSGRRVKSPECPRLHRGRTLLHCRTKSRSGSTLGGDRVMMSSRHSDISVPLLASCWRISWEGITLTLHGYAWFKLAGVVCLDCLICDFCGTTDQHCHLPSGRNMPLELGINAPNLKRAAGSLEMASLCSARNKGEPPCSPAFSRFNGLQWSISESGMNEKLRTTADYSKL